MVIFYLRKSIGKLEDAFDPSIVLANKIAKKGRNPIEYGLSEVSEDEANLKFEEWKDAFKDAIWAKTAFKYQIIMWGMALFSLGIYIYGYLNNIIYFYKPLNETDLNFLLYILIMTVIFLMIFIFRYSKDFYQKFYLLYINLFIDETEVEQISFFTNFGEIAGIIGKMGKKLTIIQVSGNKDQSIPFKERIIALNWKNVSGVAYDNDLDNRLDKALRKYAEDTLNKE